MPKRNPHINRFNGVLQIANCPIKVSIYMMGSLWCTHHITCIQKWTRPRQWRKPFPPISIFKLHNGELDIYICECNKRNAVQINRKRHFDYFKCIFWDGCNVYLFWVWLQLELPIKVLEYFKSDKPITFGFRGKLAPVILFY